MVDILGFFFFNDTATTEIYTYGHTLSLHDALPISRHRKNGNPSSGLIRSDQSTSGRCGMSPATCPTDSAGSIRVIGSSVSLIARRSEEHTSELQSLMRISYAVFCLKKKKTEIKNRLKAQHNCTTYTHIPAYQT